MGVLDSADVSYAIIDGVAVQVHHPSGISSENVTLRVIRVIDLVRQKIRAGSDPARRRSTRLSDLVDAHGLLETYPALRVELTPEELVVPGHLPFCASSDLLATANICFMLFTRRLFSFPLILVLLLSIGCASADHRAPLSNESLTSTRFIVCDDLSDLTCVSSEEHLKFRPDGTVVSGIGILNGQWELLSQTVLRIGEREFRWDRSSRLFFSPAYKGARFGYVFAADTPATRRRIESRDTAMAKMGLGREKANYQLRAGINVHDACLRLINVGDWTSVQPLVGALPKQPETPTAAVTCTVDHCNEALRRITRKSCGTYREDWEKCLAASPQ